MMVEIYYSAGWVDITAYIEAQPDFDYEDFTFIGDTQIDGKIIGMPYTSCGHCLRYNKKIFEEAGLPNPGEIYWDKKEEGWNWQSFVEMAPQLTQDLDGDGLPDQYFFSGFGGTNILAMIRAAGGDVTDEEYTKCTLTEPNALEAFQYFGDLVLEYEVQPPPEMQANELGINFTSGRIAVGGSNTCNTVRDLMPGNELEFEWDFVPCPAGSAGFRVWGDTGGMSISTDSPYPDECFQWMMYRSSKDVWEETYAQGVIMAYTDSPTRYSIFETDAFLEPLEGIDTDMILEMYTYSVPQPFVPRFPQPYQILFTTITTEVDNVLRGTKSPEEATADACTEIEAILDAGF
jgi:multiple sugar transport system substrate-binding protein